MYDSSHGTINGAANKRAIKSLVSRAAMLVLLASSFTLFAPTSAEAANGVQSDQSQDSKEQQNSGTLLALSPTGEKVGILPLKHTTVDTRISGYVASVTVKQQYQNSQTQKIDAIYSFPL